MTEGGVLQQNKKMQLSPLCYLLAQILMAQEVGLVLRILDTNSTGQLAFLDNTVAIGQVEYSPEEGINRFREWEWKGGAVPFVEYVAVTK